MDVRAQLSHLSSEARENLAARIKTRLDEDSLAVDRDVTILGGGAAGLTLALEIRRARPQTRILIV